jgi:hypothetical protein
VPADFDIHGWDIRPIEREWRSRLTDLILEEGRASSRGERGGGGEGEGYMERRVHEEQCR